MRHRFPGLSYSAALLGSGSDVLGYDTPRSRDHDWGPRLQVFLRATDLKRAKGALNRAFARYLPREVLGFSTSWGAPGKDGTRTPVARQRGPVAPQVAITTVATFFRDALGVDALKSLAPGDWLLMPQQQLLSVTRGEVFHDGLNELRPLREKLAYYPDQVWRYLLMCQWNRIGQEEAFPGRCAAVGDELGCAILTTRLVRDLMGLCFLMDRRYQPYGKWFGTAFGRLGSARTMEPLLRRVLSARTWPDRERRLCRSYSAAVKLHNALGITRPVSPACRRFHSRPYMVIEADRLAEAIGRTIRSKELKRIGYVGGVDQFLDATDVLGYPARTAKLHVLTRA